MEVHQYSIDVTEQGYQEPELIHKSQNQEFLFILSY